MTTPEVPVPGARYDEEALAEIELTSAAMIAANAAEESLDDDDVDRVLGVRPAQS